jgi:Tol biopolymer transport system component
MHNRMRKLALVSLAGVLVLGLLALAWARGAEPSGAQQDETQNCPLQDRWAISVWSGDDGTGAEQAFGTCGEGAVAVGYSIDSETQAWSRWFAGRPEISNLSTLNDMEGVIALGAAGAAPSAAAPHGRIAFGSDRDGDGEIYAMNADGTNLTKLTNNEVWDGQPAWSPDGSKIAFGSERDGNDEIYVMNADGTNVIRLTNDPEWDFGAAWSPDGAKIAFDSIRDGDYDIYVVNADGSGLTNLTMDSANNWGAAWSPDGAKIAFGSDRDGAAEVYVMNADGSEQTRLTNNPAWERGPEWSPDGSKIVFHSERDGNMEIYVMNADGTAQTRLTDSPGYDGWPSWSPDGSHIAFHSERDGDLEVYAMNADGTGQTNLTNNPAGDRLPSWSAFGGQQGTMDNCPQAGKWAISVWSGDDGTGAEQAFGSCGEGAVAVAYSIDRETQAWSRWFAGRPEISNLTAVDNMQGLIVLGGTEGGTTPTASASE